MVQNQWVNTGWKCPSCGANLSPSTVSCPYHNYKITTTPNTGTPIWREPHSTNSPLDWAIPCSKDAENNMFKVQNYPVYSGTPACAGGGVATTIVIPNN